jgi:putative PIN family toxin of toxin-antitoxin system
LDTNTIVRGASVKGSPADRIVRGCLDREFVLALSKPVLAEYRSVLNYPEILARNPEITSKRIVLLLQRLKFYSDYQKTIPVRFEFDRDPDDAKFIELAIAGKATHIISHDKDLLDLRQSHSDAARRFRQRLPRTSIVTAKDFVATVLPSL